METSLGVRIGSQKVRSRKISPTGNPLLSSKHPICYEAPERL